MSNHARDGDMQRGWLCPLYPSESRKGSMYRRNTWYSVAVVGVNFMLRCGHVFNQCLHSLNALVWCPIPSQSRICAIKFWEVLDAVLGVVGFVVKMSEMIRSSGGYFDARRESDGIQRA